MHVARSAIRRLLAILALVPAVFACAVLGAPAAGAQPAPPRVVGPLPVLRQPISALQVQAGGTEAVVTFTTSEPTAVRVDHRRVSEAPAPSTVRDPLGGRAVPLQAEAASTGAAPQLQIFATQHRVELKHLTSNTTYDVFVTATTRAGVPLAAQARFTTKPARLRVALESINILDDGDSFLTGEGEPSWFVSVAWTGGWTYGCYPVESPDQECEPGRFGEGRITPRNSEGKPLTFVFAEENFDRLPDALALYVSAIEDDSFTYTPLTFFLPWLAECIAGDGCPVGENAPVAWRMPSGVESAVQTLTLRGDDRHMGVLGSGFDSVLTFRVELFHDDLRYPAPARNVPHSTWT